jgi:trimethylamine--corrinoid protein Co-methyltransferase
MISDWRNYETWEEAGSPQAPGKANAIWKELLKAYEPPPLDDARRDELQAFVDRRKAEGGVPTDF